MKSGLLMVLAAYAQASDTRFNNFHRQLSLNFEVNTTTFDPNDPDIVEGKLTVSNEIGDSVSAGSVQVFLLDHNCDDIKNSTGLEVELFNTEYTNTSLPLTYDIELNQTLINSSPGGFVNFTAADMSVGHVLFCTRICTLQGQIEVGFRDTRFDLSFDLSNNTLSLTNVAVNELGQDTFTTDVQDTFGVDVCQCDEDFNCLSTSQSISQDESLVVCLEPTALGDASIVEITNFNLRMSDGPITYDPVSFGTVTWDADALTDISLESGTNKIKIVAPVIAQFFIENSAAIDINGNAFLEFVGSKMKRTTMSPFGLNVMLITEDKAPTCLQLLISIFMRR